MTVIAARRGICRYTVAKAVSSECPLAHVRPPRNSGISAVKPAVRALLQKKPRMSATVLAELGGFSGSAAWFRKTLPGSIRSMPRMILPADLRRSQERAQCDLCFPGLILCGDQAVASAMIDRIFHHAEVITPKAARNRRKHFLTHPLP